MILYGPPVSISSTDFYFKVIEMLQQNWALIDPHPEGGVIVWFISDGSGVFDELRFSTHEEADEALRHNGYYRWALDEEAQEFLVPPRGKYFRWGHPSGAIYSSGEYWSNPPRKT